MTRPSDIPEWALKAAMAVQDAAEAECKAEKYVYGFGTGNAKTVLDNHIARAILTAQAEATEAAWQPIETAPKGSGPYPSPGAPTVLLTDGDSIYMGFWNGRSWDDGDFFDDMGEMTHWAPLPYPPSPSLPSAQRREPEYVPQLIHYDEPPRWEFLSADMPVLHQDIGDGSAELLLDMNTRAVIGLVVFDTPPSHKA